MSYALSIHKSHVRKFLQLDNDKSQLIRVNSNKGVFDPKWTALLHRNMADKTPEIGNDWSQFIMYAVLINKDNEILTYERPPSGNEERLHGLKSVGLGGHVDEFDMAAVEHFEEDRIYKILMKSLYREVAEEAGVDKRSLASINKYGEFFIVDNSNDVGKLHLGITVFFRLEDGVDVYPEELELLNSKWESLGQLISQKRECEGWTRMIIDYLELGMQ